MINQLADWPLQDDGVAITEFLKKKKKRIINLSILLEKLNKAGI